MYFFVVLLAAFSTFAVARSPVCSSDCEVCASLGPNFCSCGSCPAGVLGYCSSGSYGCGTCGTAGEQGGCDAGYRLLCNPVALGYFAVNGKRFPCPAGTTIVDSTVPCTSGCSCCTTCPFGTTTRTGYSGSSPCFADACVGGYWYEVQSADPGGGFTSYNAALCSPCPAGTHILNTTGTSFNDCIGCPAGTWSAAKTVADSCNLCPAGTYSRTVNATSSATCIPCPVGTYSTSGASFCTQCSEGTYNPSTSQISCLNCDAGSFSGRGAVSCQTCLQGFYCPSGIAFPCQPGTFSSTIGAVSSNVCLNCSAGFFSSAIAATTSATCQPCQAGSFASSNGTISCQLCPSGTTGQRTGSTSNTSCIPCGLGTFSAEPGQSGTCPSECPAGYAGTMLGGSSLFACSPCPPGSFSASSRSTQCTYSAPGFYVNETGAKSQTPCPAGTYNNAVGASSSSYCLPCPLGTSSAVEGQTSIACLAGPLAASPLPEASKTPWEKIQYWVLPALSLLGILATYVLFGDKLFSMCAPAAHATIWRNVAGILARSAPLCCFARASSLTMSLAAMIIRRLANLQEERAKHAAAISDLMQPNVEQDPLQTTNPLREIQCAKPPN